MPDNIRVAFQLSDRRQAMDGMGTFGRNVIVRMELAVLRNQ